MGSLQGGRYPPVLAITRAGSRCGLWSVWTGTASGVRLVERAAVHMVTGPRRVDDMGTEWVRCGQSERIIDRVGQTFPLRVMRRFSGSDALPCSALPLALPYLVPFSPVLSYPYIFTLPYPALFSPVLAALPRFVLPIYPTLLYPPCSVLT